MDPELLRKYRPLLRYVEEPIREIVDGLWGIDFVVDTGFTCCGHITADNNSLYSDGRKLNGYPHRAMLELYLSRDAELAEKRDKFRADIRRVRVACDGRVLGFDNVFEAEREPWPGSSIRETALYCSYNATIEEDKELTDQRALQTEALLADLWESVADIVREHNPEAQIGHIKGKNFREVINWAHWNGIFIPPE